MEKNSLPFKIDEKKFEHFILLQDKNPNVSIMNFSQSN